jgi:hypothetical protein
MYKFIILLLLSLSYNVEAAIFYVSPTGNDSSNGSLISPYKTISKAITVVNAGDTIQVRTGTYSEKLSIWKSGLPNLPITIQNFPSETPVLEGANIALSNYVNLVTIGGNYITFSGFELRNVNLQGVVLGGYGLYSTGKDVVISNNNIHDIWEQGMVVCGDRTLIENNIITKTAQSNLKYLPWPQNWAYGLGIQAVYGSLAFPTDIIVRGNKVFYNGGEGIISIKTINPIIENNTTFDNMAVNLYITDTTGAIVRNNFVYATNKSNELYSMPARGLGVANEYNTNTSGNTGLQIYNNIVYGTAYPFTYFTQPATGGISQFKDSIITHNLFMNARSGRGAGSISTINFGASNIVNVKFQNNIIIQEDNNALVSGNPTGVSFGYNLWSKQPGITLTVFDNVSDPKLSKTNVISDPNWYSLLNTSPAIGSGLTSSITKDFFSNTRNNPPTIGPIEYNSIAPLPEPEVPPPVPTQVNIASGKVASSSSVENTTLSASKAFDGNNTTRWASAFSDNQWITVDLGSIYTVNKVVLIWETAYGKSYKIQFSTDNVNWKDVYSTTTSKGGTENITVSGRTRYVRMLGLVRATPWGFSLWDMQVNGYIDSAYNDISDAFDAVLNLIVQINKPNDTTYELVEWDLIIENSGTSWNVKKSGVQVFVSNDKLDAIKYVILDVVDQLFNKYIAS